MINLVGKAAFAAAFFIELSIILLPHFYEHRIKSLGFNSMHEYILHHFNNDYPNMHIGKSFTTEFEKDGYQPIYTIIYLFFSLTFGTIMIAGHIFMLYFLITSYTKMTFMMIVFIFFIFIAMGLAWFGIHHNCLLSYVRIIALTDNNINIYYRISSFSYNIAIENSKIIYLKQYIIFRYKGPRIERIRIKTNSSNTIHNYMIFGWNQTLYNAIQAIVEANTKDARIAAPAT
jgi:hypothetical protein